jgi:hypothetical protein
MRWLRFLDRERRREPPADNRWERTWQAVRELHDDLDPPPPSRDPLIVRGLIPYQRGEMP